MKTILAVSGSTRKHSTNHNFINAASALLPDRYRMELYTGITDLPHFNPDDDNDNPPAAVVSFRTALRQSDAVLICTPEYAMGAPGTLKNALDWTVSSMEFSKKPVALITAALSGHKAHSSLLGTLLIIESCITEDTQMLIPFAKTKIGHDSVVKDTDVLADLTKLVNVLCRQVDGETFTLLTPPEAC